MLISETHFTDKSFLTIPDYNLYHTNHADNTPHAGSAELIKNTIDHYQQNGYKRIIYKQHLSESKHCHMT
jgi:hypothetical protein